MACRPSFRISRKTQGGITMKMRKIFAWIAALSIEAVITSFIVGMLIVFLFGVIPNGFACIRELNPFIAHIELGLVFVAVIIQFARMFYIAKSGWN